MVLRMTHVTLSLDRGFLCSQLYNSFTETSQETLLVIAHCLYCHLQKSFLSQVKSDPAWLPDAHSFTEAVWRNKVEWEKLSFAVCRVVYFTWK
jgi:hypothetical protein